MLHIMYALPRLPIDYDYIVDFARILVNHGCPVNVVSKAGVTARDVLTNDEYDFDPDDPDDKELFDLISPPASPLRLEELAARKILQSNISYRETLPATICSIVDRGTCHLKLTDLYD